MALWTVPVYSQRTLSLCWEACARMMWHWRHKGLKGYKKRAGSYLNRTGGMSQDQLNIFYRHLGMKFRKNPTGDHLRQALRVTPAIFSTMSRVSGHAMVARGHNKGKYTVINPCAQQIVSFGGGADSCSAGGVELTETYVDSRLGLYIWYW